MGWWRRSLRIGPVHPQGGRYGSSPEVGLEAGNPALCLTANVVLSGSWPWHAKAVVGGGVVSLVGQRPGTQGGPPSVELLASFFPG